MWDQKKNCIFRTYISTCANTPNFKLPELSCIFARRDDFFDQQLACPDANLWEPFRGKRCSKDLNY